MLTQYTHTLKISSLILISFLFIGCQGPTQFEYQFSSKSDTLVLSTIKMKGTGPFMIGAVSASFRDTSEWKDLDGFMYYPDYPVVYPKGIEDIELGISILMFDSLHYFSHKKEPDVQQNYDLEDRILLMIKGVQNGDKVLIIDENHNSDLSDDPIREIVKWDWFNDKQIVPCTYEIETAEESHIDTGWIKIGAADGYLLQSTSQHLLSQFSVDDKGYTICIADYNPSTFCFVRPIICITEEDGIKSDTVLKKDIIGFGEYIQLGENHYKFDHLYNGCGTVVLVKEPHFDDLTGIQVGMKYPEFQCLTTNGDTLSSMEMINDKPLIVANFSGCTSDSYLEFNALNFTLEKDYYVIGIESGIPDGMEGNLVDVDVDFNKGIYNHYRNAYSSYDCYVIGRTGRILEVFDIFDWEVNSSELLSEALNLP